MGGAWNARPDEVVGNGDVVVRTAKGALVALIYAVPSKPDEAMRRAVALIKAAAPSWCQHCGKDTSGSNECASCAAVLDAHAAA